MRNKGILPFSGNFESQFSEPLDGRQRVEERSDLFLEDTWNALDGETYAFPGMFTVVYADTPEKNGGYILLDYDYTDPANWVFLSGGISATKEDDTFILSAGDVSNGYVTLSSTPNENYHIDIYYNGILLEEGIGNDYEISGEEITLHSDLLIEGEKVIVKYYV